MGTAQGCIWLHAASLGPTIPAKILIADSFLTVSALKLFNACLLSSALMPAKERQYWKLTSSIGTLLNYPFLLLFILEMAQGSVDNKIHIDVVDQRK